MSFQKVILLCNTKPYRFMKLFPILFLLQMAICSSAFSQNLATTNDAFYTITGGFSIIDEKLPEAYSYRPIIFLASTSIWHRRKFLIYGEFQFNRAKNPLDDDSDIEFGLNAGIMFLQPLFKPVVLTAAIGSGPHFVTVETSRQANGFIFSDNFELGLNIGLDKIKTILQVRARYRHISNAGLQEPNGGIDNLFLLIGFARTWK